ncbi:hypothetical protein BsIDN1_42350 [Bacillus safensis]|uniref:DNA repair protein RecN n=1 Tax=Bacillus safensis TaxID=561879 RepID=A0A5S9MAU7_BACIA|nr:hypothetical protein BsIDN1_42350 [Bacillus safensis]
MSVSREQPLKNFAIIEELTVSFEKGLTVLTGETGAGKSIMIDAVSLLVGGRGSSEFVRYGEKKKESWKGFFLYQPIILYLLYAKSRELTHQMK